MAKKTRRAQNTPHKKTTAVQARRRRRRKKKSKMLPIILILLVLLLTAGAIYGIWNYFQEREAAELKARQELQQELKEKEEAEKAQKEEQAKASLEAAEKKAKEQKENLENGEAYLSLVARASELDDYKLLTPSETTASSSLQGEHAHGPECVFDEDETTSWQEGEENGPGIEQCLTAKFDQTYSIKYLNFQLGNFSDDAAYYENNRPQELEIRVGDQLTGTITFKDVRKLQWVKLTQEAKASEIQFTIKSVYEGEECDDTCISEICIYGK